MRSTIGIRDSIYQKKLALSKMRRRLTELPNYRGNGPLESRRSGQPVTHQCSLIVDPITENEIDVIRSGSRFGYMYTEEEESSYRDINEIINVLNSAIQQGNTPYYWSRTQNRYYPISRALRLEIRPLVGFSGKEASYDVIVRVGSLERPVNINSICSIDVVSF